MKTWKKVLLSIACTLLGLIILTVGTVAYLIYQGGNELFNTDIHVTAPQGIETEETVSMSYTTVKHISSTKR